MASRGESQARSRRSIAPIPQTALRNSSDKENFTSDLKRSSLQPTLSHKKLRSKSLGPGGLDALNGAAGNRRKSTAAFPLKSILKPAIPVSPIQTIPAFQETRSKTPARSPQKTNNSRGASNGLLIDFSTSPAVPVIGTEKLSNPFDTFNPSPARNGREAFRLEEEQRRERETKAKHERAKRAALEQRAARRKSMANRRVSFAPEATLHTWNVVELMEDSTASSANSTRRTSAVAQASNGTPGTPEALEQFSPATQRIMHQQNNQHNFQSSQEELDDPGDDKDFSSSPFSGDSTVGGEDTTQLDPDNGDSVSDSDMDNDSTAMSLDNATRRSTMSSRSDGSTTDSSARLDRSLRLAADIAGTNGIGYDENEDLSMAFENHEIIGAFKPWIKKGTDRSGFDADSLTSRFDQENINPFQKSSGSRQPQYADDGDETGMDLTKPVGRILSSQRRTSSFEPDTRRISSTKSLQGDQTMEFTNVIGGIKPSSPQSGLFSGDSNIAEDEEMTMEFTSVFGGVLNKNAPHNTDINRSEEEPYQRDDSEDDVNYPELTEVEMEMTAAVGGILPSIEERTEPLEDETMGMEITNAIGKILPSFRPAGGMQGGESEPELLSSPFQETTIPSPAKPRTPLRVPEIPFQDESPSLAHIRLQPARRRSSVARSSTTPTKATPRQLTPVNTTPTPSQAKSPRITRRTTSATPTTPNTPSPRKPRLSPRKSSKPDSQTPNLTPTSIFQYKENGQASPRIVLQSRRRSPSGLGIDKEGLGSPRVAEILDRRRSIGEDAQNFTPSTHTSRAARFNSVNDRSDHGYTESGQDEQRKVVSFGDPQLIQEPGVNIREMISSLTPKKNKLKGRKSLHVGAAKGLLGKRPIELDIDDEDENDTPKRPRPRQASPVKNIKLPAPPSKAVTIGKLSSSFISQNNVKSPMQPVTTTPKDTRHKSVDIDVTGERDDRVTTVDQGAVEDPDSADSEIKPLQLSEFLEMTNIRFMELTTTKRRHTLAPDIEKKRVVENDAEATKEIGLEDCVAAGFCTIPMLELYQHSCRELKSYISEGRRIIRSIETETYGENPPLFQEYVTAPPDIRVLMDNQFRNVKCHARLLSKSMWYEWRMKLLEGLKQGLDRHVDEMAQDAKVLSRKETLLNSVVPGLAEKHENLQIDAHNLQKAVEEMENCDQEELRQTRERLAALDLEVSRRRKDLDEAQAALEENSTAIKAGMDKKKRLLKEIHEAEAILEECRGWDVKEVYHLKDAVQKLEKTTGWTILSVDPGASSKYDPALSMRYNDELRLDFHPAMFRVSSASKHQNSQLGDFPVTLSYSPLSTRNLCSTISNAPPEICLMLHALRTRLSHATHSSISPKTLLSGISQTWDIASSLRNEIRMLGYCGITKSKNIELNVSEPALLKTRCIFLGFQPTATPKKTDPASQMSKFQARIDIDFTIKPRPIINKGNQDEPGVGIDVDIDVSASKIYGFTSDSVSEQELSEALMSFIQRQDGKGKKFGHGLWRDAVKDLGNKVFC
ncbi:hypothetical protein LOZ57_003215 [Ophidiomyces ophidiicola]|uniref:uncharacterized protein n=1 Tax=Ophidiomyces ophidiicola TaxID=1387563 RepID=UPI0020C59963|nr:uncharacterized protein LOZ57_003215 [Ophidiomyces ophidiicola]KAI1947486.1 hypothetical protein LOZ57_003215 [Ophidiomyces ophidiicola]KAI2059822.1 hypothetical protein LOZ43_001986 [Ophidiomyces ophidiicola]KAI2092794.1 hypothetical protein LOZ36_000347 [Ophidiomyces ophidiicola]